VSRCSVSVIVPTANEGAVIDDLLADLRAIRPRDWEIIVVDGGSTDDTVERANLGADRVLVKDRGRALQMNAGAAVAQGEILWFLHADSRVDREAGRELCDIAASGVGWGRFDVRLSGGNPLLRVVETTMGWRSRLTGIVTGDQAMFVRRDWFESVGGFPPLPLMEDLALSRELRRRAWPSCLSAKIETSSRRWERYGIGRTVWLMWRLRLQYFLGVPVERLARAYRSCSSPTPES
jgi:rSAM/selenodomain-associated transferase 2